MVKFELILRAFYDFYNALNISHCYTVNVFAIFLLSIIFMTITTTYKLIRMVNAYFQNKTFEHLYKAVEENNTFETVMILKKNPHLINQMKHPEGYTPFLIACANANTQLVKYMIKKGADVQKHSANNESPIYLASFYYIRNRTYKNATCIRELYYAGADINAHNNKGITPLQMAAMFGHTHLVKWLLLKNASMISSHPHPYVIAKSQGHQDVAALFLTLSMNREITFNR